MDKANHLELELLELSKFLKYETYYDQLQTYFSHDKLQFLYMDCDTFVKSIETQNNIKDLRNFRDFFDFSDLDESHELFSNNNK